MFTKRIIVLAVLLRAMVALSVSAQEFIEISGTSEQLASIENAIALNRDHPDLVTVDGRLVPNPVTKSMFAREVIKGFLLREAKEAEKKTREAQTAAAAADAMASLNSVEISYRESMEDYLSPSVP